MNFWEMKGWGYMLPTCCKILNCREAPMYWKLELPFWTLCLNWNKPKRVIVLDAMKGEGVPGTVYKIPLESLDKRLTCIASMHGFDIFRVMALTQQQEIPSGMVFGVEPEAIDWSMTLSQPGKESLPYMVAAVFEELGGIACNAV